MKYFKTLSAVSIIFETTDDLKKYRIVYCREPKDVNPGLGDSFSNRWQMWSDWCPILNKEYFLCDKQRINKRQFKRIDEENEFIDQL